MASDEQMTAVEWQKLEERLKSAGLSADEINQCRRWADRMVALDEAEAAAADRWRGPGMANAVGMTLRDFDNGLKVLRSIDLYELEKIGYFKWERWELFRDSPYGFFIVADEDERAIIWAALAKRHRGAVA